MIVACLQLYRQLLSLVTFLRVHSNLKKVSYLPCRNRYPNLKTTCHIKVKFLLWTKRIENLLLAKYIISVTAPLMFRTDWRVKFCFWLRRKILFKYPSGIYLLKVNSRNTTASCEICSKLTIKTPERRQWHCSCVFIVNFEHISHIVLVFLFLTLNK